MKRSMNGWLRINSNTQLQHHNTHTMSTHTMTVADMQLLQQELTDLAQVKVPFAYAVAKNLNIVSDKLKFVADEAKRYAVLDDNNQPIQHCIEDGALVPYDAAKHGTTVALMMKITDADGYKQFIEQFESEAHLNDFHRIKYDAISSSVIEPRLLQTMIRTGIITEA